MWRRFFSVFVLVSLSLVHANSVGAESKAQPNGRIELKTRSVAAGIGYSWGEGVLTYAGRPHSFRISGLTAADVGVSEAAAAGDVYHLKTLKDFDGTYTAADAGVAVGGGMGIATMRNEKGVVIQLHSTTRGLEFTLGASGVKIELIAGKSPR